MTTTPDPFDMTEDHEPVYAEGQGVHRVEPDPFDKEIGPHRSNILGECAECEVEQHQDDLFSCEACGLTLCERHLDEDEHECVPVSGSDDEE